MGYDLAKGFIDLRKTASIKLDPDLWKEIQHRCIDENKDYSDFVEVALKEALKRKRP